MNFAQAQQQSVNQLLTGRDHIGKTVLKTIIAL